MPIPFRSAQLLAGLVMAVLVGPAAAQDSTTPPTATDPVVVVDAQPISRGVFDAYGAQRSAQLGDPALPEVRETLTDELIVQQLLVQEALDRNLLNQDPQLQLQYRNMLATAAVRQLMRDNQPSVEAIQAEYQTLIADYDDREFRASHILVDSEDTARSLIAELDQGANFAELAQAHSTDSSSSQGGDLGWFTADVMVRDFSEAVAALEIGQYTPEPVQTEFGWHVIHLAETRQAPPPPLEELQSRIVQQLQGQMINDYLVDKREQASIEIKQP